MPPGHVTSGLFLLHANMIPTLFILALLDMILYRNEFTRMIMIAGLLS